MTFSDCPFRSIQTRLSVCTQPKACPVLLCRHESGDFYALDIGGTNFRVLYTRLAAGHAEIVSHGQASCILGSCWHREQQPCLQTDACADAACEWPPQHEEAAAEERSGCRLLPVEANSPMAESPQRQHHKWLMGSSSHRANISGGRPPCILQSLVCCCFHDAVVLQAASSNSAAAVLQQQ